MPQGEWIDSALSSELPVLRDRGEGQHLEFMVQYPTNGHELSKEIAAFASSNAGMILIGVDDDGSLVGLDEIETAKKRDTLCRRIEGLCTASVKPSITPVVNFVQEDGKVVLVIRVPRGLQPIYYSRNTPYVRHLSQSRPAEPHEVIERIIEWSNSSPLAQATTAAPEEAARSQFLSSLAGFLIRILILGDEFEDRKVNPWLDKLRFELADYGSGLREFAVDDIAVELGIDNQLLEIVNRLDSAESHLLTMGADSWKRLTGHISFAVESARQIKAAYIDTVSLSEESVQHLQETIRHNARRLADLDQRAEQMIEDAQIEDVQSNASEIGNALLYVGYYRIENQNEDDAQTLLSIGRELHLLETERISMDGGLSMRRVVDKLHNLNERLQELISQDE